jgi:hypothetical protein
MFLINFASPLWGEKEKEWDGIDASWLPLILMLLLLRF